MRLSPFLAIALLLFITAACTGSKAPPIRHDYSVSKITGRVYVIHGPDQSPNKENQGFINNPGFVLVRGGVVVVDPGSSVQIGEMVLRKIAAITKDPVIAVFNTHFHGDHWLGNQAIKAAYPKAVIYAHPRMVEAIKSGEGDNWAKLLNDATDGATRGTVAVAPDLGLDHDESLKLHGTTFRLYHNDRAHTDNDLMVEVVEEGALFLGDNVRNKSISANFPEHGSTKGQIDAIDMALKSKATHFIPGHGQSGGREIALAQRQFLVALRTSVKKYYDQGMSDFEMKDKVMNDLAAYKDWVFFNNLGRVINATYLQIESEAF
jgi:glyoxylase-like metal-dependent hydrolase (beta-lactamase superfamily II)